MKKRLWMYGKRYVFFVILMLMSALCVRNIYSDIAGNTTTVVMENLNNDTEIFTLNFDNKLRDYLSHIEQMARVIGVDLLENTAEVRDVVDSYHSMYGSIAITNADGNRIFGDELDINLAQEDLLDTLVYDRKSVVYEKGIRDSKNRNSILIAAPIVYNDKTIGIIEATICIADLNEIMETWTYSKDSCAFLMTKRGNYLTQGKRFNELLGGESNGFLTYLSNSSIRSGHMKKSDIEKEMMKGQKASTCYSYKGEQYVASIFPCDYAGWYIGIIELEQNMYASAFVMQKDSVTFFVITMVCWIFWICYYIYMNYRSVREREILERYETIHKMENSLLFEFCFNPKKLEFFGDGVQMFGGKVPTMIGEEVYEVYDYVHKDDASFRSRVHQFYDNTAQDFSAEIRIRNFNGEYGWYRISGTLIKDKRFGINQKFVGKIENADQQITEEKNLVQRAENDLLTGVLNKKTMEEKVVECLKNIEGNHRYIFFMVDLDNFKNVNDCLGHIYGDKAIVDTATRLTELFPKHAYVGRLGGDEFAVCAVYDAFDEESLWKYIKNKAEKICEVNRRTYRNGEKEVSISSSVGIAVAPDSATDFATLYNRADQALYQSKNGGKNCYTIYDR